MRLPLLAWDHSKNNIVVTYTIVSALGFVVGNYVRVLKGPHKNLGGKVCSS